MSNLFINIKSDYIFKIIVGYIPYIKFLKLMKYSKTILNKLNITNDIFRQVSEIKKVLDPSYQIEKYYIHFKLKEDKKVFNKNMDINESILYKCINSSDFNIELELRNKNFETIINNIYKINLIIEYESIFYLKKLNKECTERLFILLNKNKAHIKELTIKNIYLKEENIIKIIHILNRIFNGKKINYSSNNIKINDINNNHFVKKLNLFDNYAHYNIKTFLDKINNIIPLNQYYLNINFNRFQRESFDEVNEFINMNVSSLKSLELSIEFIQNFFSNMHKEESNEFKTHTINFCKFFNLPKNNIEILDLSKFELHPIILVILDSNFMLKNLKVIKLNIYFGAIDEKNLVNYINKWNFILELKDTLEDFELNFSYHLSKLDIFDNLISALNKVTNLQRLKLSIKIDNEILLKFNNFENMKYLNILISSQTNSLNKFFTNFKNLESLAIDNITRDCLITKENIFIFPSKLKSLKLTNFNLDEINLILEYNKDVLYLIQNLEIDLIKVQPENFRRLLYNHLSNYKSLKKLFIKFEEGKYDNSEWFPIFKLIPSLTEIKIKIFEDYYRCSSKEYGDFVEEIRKFITPNIINVELFPRDCKIFLSY